MPSDSITVLRALGGIATKRFRRDRSGRLHKSGYGRAKHFSVELVDLHGIADLTALLSRLATDPYAFVIRGRPLPGIDLCRTRRLVHPDRETGEPATFEPTPRHWFMLDLDGVPTPAACEVDSDPDEAVEYLIGLLPPASHDASCTWQWSSSQNVTSTDTLSAHLWFWAERPLADVDLRRWAADVNRTAGRKLIDPAPFSAVQPHYTAAPVFEGMPDPLPRRSGFRQGLDEAVSLAIPPCSPRRVARGASGLSDARGFEQHLARIGTADGFRQPLVAAVASYVGEHGPEHLDIEALKARLRSAIDAADPGDRSDADIARYASDRHLDEILEWVIGQERAKRLQPTFSTALPPFFPGPAGDRDAALEEQRQTIAGWFERSLTFVGLQQEVEDKRAAAFAAEGLDDSWLDLDLNETDAKRRARKGAITRRIRREVAIAHGYEGGLPGSGERLLVSGTQGSGKSRTAAEQVARIRLPVAVWWLVPTLEKAEEQAREYAALAEPESLPVLVVRGRSAPDPDNRRTSMCPRHAVVNRAAAAGVNVRREICRLCPLRDSCGYLRQEGRIRALPGGLFLMARDYAFLPSPAPQPDLVIVDEDVSGIAGETVTFAPERLLEAGAWKKPEDAADWLRVAAALRYAVVAHPGRELASLREADITAADLKQAAIYLREASEAAVEGITGTMPDAAIARLLDRLDGCELHKAGLLVRQVRREWDRGRDGLNTIVYRPGGEGRDEVIEIAYLRSPQIASATPLLALDGTGSLLLNRKIWGEAMQERRIAIERDAEVVQVRGKTFSRQSITGCDARGHPRDPASVAEATRLRRAVADLVGRLPGRWFVAASKQAEEALIPGLPPGVLTGHFGALRGINRYEGCETAIVVGREQVSPENLERLTRPFTASDAEPFMPFGFYGRQSRMRRMRDGSTEIAAVQVHPDPRCQAVLEQIREAEIVQAIDRVRPIFNRRRIWILTDVVVDVTVDRTMRWGEMAEVSRFTRAFERTGRTVALLTDGELARCFPDLWSSAGAVKKDGQRNGLRGDKFQIDILFGKCPPLSAEYRRNRQPGSPSRVAIAAGVPDPRAALEAVVGAVSAFRLVQAEPEVPHATATGQAPFHDGVHPALQNFVWHASAGPDGHPSLTVHSIRDSAQRELPPCRMAVQRCDMKVDPPWIGRLHWWPASSTPIMEAAQ